MADRVAGKVAIVTGAASGIGLATAKALHAEGAAVVMADINGAEEDLAHEIGDEALGVHADVTSDEDMRRLVEVTVERFGRVDVICNNAGIDGVMAPIGDNDVENFDRVVAVNLRGVFLGTHHAIRAMTKAGGGGGSIVNVSSVAGVAGVPGASAYCASKAGVLGITRAAAVEYASQGIRVNAVCPGVVETPLMRGVDQASLDAVLASTPMSRLGDPQEVAAMILFLASDESSFITGAVMAVDGGMTSI